MNKKLMAVAVAGALAAPAMAFAQASNVQIYGRVNTGFDNYRSTGSAAAATDQKSRYRVFDFGSRLGFRGVENLGGGLSAVFLMESGVNVDSGNNLGQAAAINTSTGFLSSRIGHVGLQGNWGLLTIGRSNVFWGNGRNDQTGANYISGNTAPTFAGTFGRGMSVGITRVSNLLQYTSPTFSGFNAVLSYSPNNQEATGVGANADGKLWGVTVQGQYAQIIGGYDWVKNTSNSTAALPSGSNTGNKFRIGWAYQPGAQVSFLHITTKLDKGGAAGAGSVSPGVIGAGGVDPTSASVKQRAWGLNWEHVFGNIQALAQWLNVRDATGCTLAATCSNTNARHYMIGGRYLFSKRTAAYLTTSQIKNAAAYNLDHLGGSYTSGTAAVGADPRIWAIGVLHNF
ncbi:MAG: porin [Betaproteobacteria bacterium]|nr:porin [Betaproteobacteria bacterium]